MPARSPSRRRWGLAAAAVVLHLVYAHLIPASPTLSAPDEEEHWKYVEALAIGHRLPVLRELPHPIELPSGDVEFAFRPTGLDGPSTYQAQHPPLAYLCYVPARLLLDVLGLPRFWLRFVGLAWSLVALYALCHLTDDVFARDGPSLLANALPGAVLLPAPVYLCAAINNDGLAFALGSLLLWRTLRLSVAPPAPRDDLWLGLLLAAGLACKLNLIVFVPVALWLRLRQAGPERWRGAALICGLAAAPVVLWAMRSHSLYGLWLPRAHARPVILHLAQLRQDSAVLLVAVQSLLVICWSVPSTLVPQWLMLLYGWDRSLLFGIVLWTPAIMAALGLRRLRGRADLSTVRAPLPACAMLYILILALVLHQFLFQDAETGLHAGRYYLPTLGALMALILVGIEAATPPEWQQRTGRLIVGLYLLLCAWFVPLAGAFGQGAG